MRQVIEAKAQELTYQQICQEMVLGPTPNLGGKIGSDIYNLVKKITTLRHVGVRKSKLLGVPLSIESEGKVKTPIKTIERDK